MHIKQEESSKPFKIFHISKLYELFRDYVFVDDEKGDVNTSQAINWSQNLSYIRDIWLPLLVCKAREL